MAIRVTEDDGSQWVDAETFDELLAALKRVEPILQILMATEAYWSRDPSNKIGLSLDLTFVREAIAKAEAA
jgi:hypothetical protein